MLFSIDVELDQSIKNLFQNQLFNKNFSIKMYKDGK